MYKSIDWAPRNHVGGAFRRHLALVVGENTGADALKRLVAQQHWRYGGSRCSCIYGLCDGEDPIRAKGRQEKEQEMGGGRSHQSTKCTQLKKCHISLISDFCFWFFFSDQWWWLSSPSGTDGEVGHRRIVRCVTAAAAGEQAAAATWPARSIRSFLAPFLFYFRHHVR